MTNMPNGGLTSYTSWNSVIIEGRPEIAPELDGYVFLTHELLSRHLRYKIDAEGKLFYEATYETIDGYERKWQEITEYHGEFYIFSEGKNSRGYTIRYTNGKFDFIKENQ